MDPIRDAFQKAKEDIDSLRRDVEFLRINLRETREKMIEICEIMQKINEKTPLNTPKHPFDTSTQTPQIPTHPTHPSTHNLPLEALKPKNLHISTGNQGVPTDRQTDRQTHQQTQIRPKTPENSIEDAAKMLESLDDLKKDIRLKFKRLTEQEILVFSMLYQIDEEEGPTDYKTLSEQLKLSESSIRDYIGRLIKKGIPVEKKRINNKQIQLSVSKNLRKIASLSTILQLRDI
jgi:DNA-binding MarR family transcriptional regulator